MTTIYLEDKLQDRAQLAAKLQHAFGGIPLFLTAIQKFSEGVELPMAGVELVIAIAVLGSFIKDVRDVMGKRKHGHHGTHKSVGWFDLAAGAMLIFEAFHSPHTKAAYLRPQFLSGVITIGLGMMHGRLHGIKRRRRYLKFDESGVQGRLGPFRSFTFAWKDLASVDVTNAKAILQRTDGKVRTINLSRLHNADDVRQAIATHAQQAGVSRVATAVL